jgi:hypothetical protein
MISSGGGAVIHRNVRRKGVTGEIFGDTRNTFSWEWYEINSTSIGRAKRSNLKMIRCSTVDKSTVYLFDPCCTLLNITQGYSGLLTTVTMLLCIEEGRGQCVYLSSLKIYSRMCSAAFYPDESSPPSPAKKHMQSVCFCGGGGC